MQETAPQIPPPADTQAAPTPDGPGAAPHNAEPHDGKAAAPDSLVRFYSDVQPILYAHCIKCHGPKRPAADCGSTPGDGPAGGDSESRSSADRWPTTSYTPGWPRANGSTGCPKMPGAAAGGGNRDDPPLGQAGFPLVRGTGPIEVEVGEDRGVARPVGRPLQSRVRLCLAYIIAFLVIQVGMLFVIRSRTACRRGLPWTTGRIARCCRVCQAVCARELLLVMAVVGRGRGDACRAGHVLGWRMKWRCYRQPDVGDLTALWTRSVYGYPPKPVRLEVEPSVTRYLLPGQLRTKPRAVQQRQLPDRHFSCQSVRPASLADRGRRTRAGRGAAVAVEIKPPGTTADCCIPRS